MIFIFEAIANFWELFKTSSYFVKLIGTKAAIALVVLAAINDYKVDG
jgi:hypothetical protein